MKYGVKTRGCLFNYECYTDKWNLLLLRVWGHPPPHFNWMVLVTICFIHLDIICSR